MDAQQNADPLGDQQPVGPARVQLAQLLRSRREVSNRSQSWVAKQLHTNQPTVSRWESGSTLPAPETIRAFWQICAQPAKSAVSALELDQALALHRRALEERARVPKQTPPATGETPLPDQPSPPPQNGKGRLVALTAVGAVALLAAAAWAGVQYGGSAPKDASSPAAPSPAAARPAPTAACDGDSCASLEPATTTCAKDATTTQTGYDYGVRVELRYSASCHAAWAKMSGTSAGDRVMVTPKQGNAQEYRQQYGHDAHTRMVAAPSPDSARACAIVDGRGTVCATSTAQR
ncbi:DUF2690 domain-containing protein [Streptomyces nojiriensis]|uniref:DUF2690 domain-containing protein n=1 Tax=Streptomyces nojiriensis TaxID=66374 RepID=UPI0035D646AC